jgi:hypothetical protein
MYVRVTMQQKKTARVIMGEITQWKRPRIYQMRYPDYCVVLPIITLQTTESQSINEHSKINGNGYILGWSGQISTCVF